MEGLTNNSFLLSPLYRVMLYAAILPSAYFIWMVVGGGRHSFKLSVWAVAMRAVIGWVLIIGIYDLCGLLFRFTMNDLGAFIDATKGSNHFVRYYPVAVFIVAVAGLWYPRADFFNINRTRSKRVLLFLVCFTPLYLMLGYMLFVKSDLWGLCLRFGFRSSLLAFTISLPIIFYNAPDSLTQVSIYVIQFLFRVNPSNSNDESLSE
jgi:hypothetical protein